MRKQIVDIVYGCAGLLFSVFCFVYLIPTQIRARPAYAAEASIFPRLAALIIGIAGLALIVSRIIALPDKKALWDRANYAVDWRAALRQAVFIAAMAVYLALINPLGFVLATTAFVFAMLHYFGSTALAKNAAIAIVFSVAVYLLFSRLFQVSLAPGLLPF